MGWDINYSNLTKKDCVNELLSSMQRSQWLILGYASTSEGAYFAVKIPAGNEFIYCAMIQKRGKYFAVKTMDEGMGPAMHDCPLRLLDLVKGEGTYSAQWRLDVKAFHEHKKSTKSLVKSIQPGATIMLYKNQYTVIQNNGTHLVAVKDGTTYKINKSHFKSISIEA